MFASYIGITDFMNFAQVRAMRSAFLRYRRPGLRRLLHVGVMMSHKTLNGIETRWSKAFPQNGDIASIFSFSDTFNCLHYADYDHDTNFGQDLAHAIAVGGNGLHALQLDMVWPDPAEIASSVKDSGKSIEVILQIGKNAIEMADNNPDIVASLLSGYDGIIHRVLLDKSMGRGLGMDAEGLLPYARAIAKKFPHMGIGAAGGLGPHSMDLVRPLIAEFPHLSIDAQGQLRPSGNALDPIDWTLAELYLERALALFA